MISNCFRYYKGCEECQRFCDIQLVPAALLHPIIKLWPFRGWGLDFIGQINPPSSKGHRFVLVATDYFTKWTEAFPLKNMTHREVIEFITKHIIPRRYAHLSNLTGSSSSIHLHIMLRPMDRPSQVTRF